MSKLTLTTTGGQWQLNVLTFSSPLYGTVTSAQTKTMAMHFPIKVTQPDVEFSVIFRSEGDYEGFQRFVRNHQQEALAKGAGGLCTLNWPQRNIDNWTGVIKKFKAGGMRSNVAPRASFTVDLVDSMVSTRTDISTIPNLFWETIFGRGMPDGVLGLPSALENQVFGSLLGQDLFGNLVPRGL